MPKYPRAGLLLLAACSAAAVQAHANEPAQAQLDPVVVTAGGFEQKLTAAPASISVITRQDLEERHFSNLAEALDGVEGVDIRQGTGKTGGLNISIRGLPSEYTLILIDGRRQNPAGSVTPNGFGSTSTSFIPPLSAIERIEIIRGPMSTLYGSDAMGGVVNIITRAVAPEWGLSATFGHSFQENSDYGDDSSGSVYLSGPLLPGTLGLSVRGRMYDRSASNLQFEDGSTVGRRGAAPVDGRHYSGGARLTFAPGNQHSIYADIQSERQRYNNDDCQLGNLDGFAGGSASAGCQQPAPEQINGYSETQRFNRDQLALVHDASLPVGILTSSLTRNFTETLGRTIPGTLGMAYEGFPDIVAGDARILESTDTVFDSKLVTGFGQHRLILGGQWWDAEVIDSIASQRFEQKSWALFAETELALGPNLNLTLGARHEDHEAFGGHFSPRVYLVWDAGPSWTIKGGVSRGYKVPTLNQLHDGINGVTGQGAVISIGTPGLEPETTTNTELAAYYDSGTGLSANITFFHNRFDDKIATGDSIPNCHWSGNPGLAGCMDLGPGFLQESFAQSVNIDKAETQGMELAGAWQFAPAWSLSTSYTYTESEQKSGPNAGAPLVNTPEHLASALLRWQLNERTRLWLRSDYRGKRSRFLSQAENLSASDLIIHEAAGDLEAYDVMSLGAAYRLTDNITINGTIYNLLGRNFMSGTYYTTASGNTAWVSDYAHIGRSTDGTIEEGRRLWLSVSLNF